MPTTTDNSHGRRQRTLAQKLQWLRDLKTPRGEQPPSYEATARRITELTGVSISGPYYWELVTGRTTNPKLHHLQALARYFHVPAGYLADDGTDFRQLEAELELLHSLKQRGVKSIHLQGATGPSADLPTLETLLGKLNALEGFADEEAREIALRLQTLDQNQRAALHALLNEPELLQALQEDDLRTLARLTAGLSAERLAAATSVLHQPELLDALGSASVRELASGASALSEDSRRAILALITHLRQVESQQTG